MRKNVLFINHPEKKCRVHQFGENVFGAINHKFLISFIECNSADSLKNYINTETTLSNNI